MKYQKRVVSRINPISGSHSPKGLDAALHNMPKKGGLTKTKKLDRVYLIER